MEGQLSGGSGRIHALGSPGRDTRSGWLVVATLGALLVRVGDRTLVEKYYDGSTADSVWDVESVTKSIVSSLVGIAIAEGKISSVDATLAELLPDRAAGMSRSAARTTLRRLLSMSGGFPQDDFTKPRRWQTVRDPVRVILRAHDPGLVGFTYSNQGAHLIAAILTEATGVSLLDYARAHPFDPLGIVTRPAFTGGAAPSSCPQRGSGRPPVSRSTTDSAEATATSGG